MPKTARVTSRARTAAKTVRQKPGPKPFDFTDEIITEVCTRLACGEYLTDILGPLKGDHLPKEGVWYAAIANNKPEGISEVYARAREAQAWRWAEEVRRVAYDSSGDTIIDEKGNQRLDNEWVQRSRLKVDTLKWLLSKFIPKTFGEKLDLTSDGDKLEPGVVAMPALKRP